MPLEPPDGHHFQVACGYAELGMHLDANEQLEKINPFNRAAPEVLGLRVSIYSGLKKWELMQEVARRLADFQPNELQWRISYAYATRRSESIEAAKEILLNAQPVFPNETIIKYNLACYECQSGNLEIAKEYLQQCFEMDSNWRLQALDDEDLKPLWDQFGSN